MRLREPWQFEKPACAKVGVEDFFAADADDPNPRDEGDYAFAKKICAGCVHRVECAEWGIANESHGVWGGMTPNERRSVRRLRKIRVARAS